MVYCVSIVPSYVPTHNCFRIFVSVPRHSPFFFCLALFYLRACTHTHTHTHTHTQATVPSSLPSRSVGSTPLRKSQLPSPSPSSSSPHHLPSSSPPRLRCTKEPSHSRNHPTFRVCLTPVAVEAVAPSSNNGLPNES